jgi:dTDP-glucose 4,6-dehydratase
MAAKRRVVITGGAGFIGSHLCDLYLRRGWSVLAVDNFVTGSRANVAHLRGVPGFELRRQDVTRRLAVEGPVALVLHFASPASPPDYQRFAIETLRAGSDGTRLALDLARAKGARLVLASTSEVYGDPDAAHHPQREDYWGNVNSVGPRSMYDEAKRYAEALTMAYRRSLGADTGIVRIFNTYGPRMRLNDGRALPQFFAQALRGVDITIYGTGKQTRSFCYVSDLVDGIARMAASRDPGPVNLGNPVEIPVQRLAEEIRALSGSSSRIVYRAAAVDDPRQRKPDIGKAKRLLGWAPKVARAEGLAKTLPYFRDAVRTAP